MLNLNLFKRTVTRGISLVGALFLLLFLAGCGSDSSTGSKETSSGEKASEVKPIELKMSHFMSPQHKQHVGVMEPFAKEVEKVTEGRVKITIYSGGALGKPDGQYESAISGITDIAFGLQGYTPGKFPATSVMELPFLATSPEGGSLSLWELYEKSPQVAAEYDQTKVLWLFTSEPSQILTSKKEVKTVADLKGLKLRSPSASANAMIESLGAIPVSIPMSDTYDAMQKGVVDGAMAPLSAIKDFNLQDVTKYIFKGDYYVSTFFMVMNKNSWEKISPQDQATIEKLIGKTMSQKAGQVFEGAGKEGIEIAEKNGVAIYTPTDEEKLEWKKSLEPVVKKWLEEQNSKGLPAQKIYDEAVQLNEKNR